MRFPVVLLISTLPFVVSVLAHSLAHSKKHRHIARSVTGGLAIPISKHKKFRGKDGVVNSRLLRDNVKRSSK
ncbi:hypothetical protein EI94DRAFT_1745514 [Lactarius quietus]|nr:hypothetical protein EI94DRAFT_1745514 [Lactarius quietus]